MDKSVPHQTVVEATVRLLKVGRKVKWGKTRYVRLEKSPSADHAILVVFKNEAASRKSSKPKRLLRIGCYYGTESGFLIEKERNTLGILCRSETVVLAFESYHTLMIWENTLRHIFGYTSQFHVRVSKCPADSVLEPYMNQHVRLHVHDGRFCVTADDWPRIVAEWDVGQLIRYGAVHNKFCFESGERAGRNRVGMHMFLSSQNEQIHLVFKKAATDQLNEYLRSRGRASAAAPVKETIGYFGTIAECDRQNTTTVTASRSASIHDDGPMAVSTPTDRNPSLGWVLQNERRPLLGSVASNASQHSPYENVALSEGGIVNDVFDRDSTNSQDDDAFEQPKAYILSDHDPTPFRFPKQVPPVKLPCDSGHSGKCPCENTLGIGSKSEEPVRDPLRKTAASENNRTKQQHSHVWIPAIPCVSMPVFRDRRWSRPPMMCSVCADRRNYVNQPFIDSLHYYYNFDAVICPTVLKGIPIGYLKATKCKTPGLYVAMDPPTPTDKHERPVDSPPPPDPSSDGRTNDHLPPPTVAQPAPAENVRELVKAYVPPWFPLTLPRPGSTDLSSRLIRQSTAQSSLPNSHTTLVARRAMSMGSTDSQAILLPNLDGAVKTWSQGGSGGRRRSKSVFATKPPDLFLASSERENVARTASMSTGGGSLNRREQIRASSRKAKKLFQNFLKMRKERVVISDTSDASSRSPEVSKEFINSNIEALDLDVPVFSKQPPVLQRRFPLSLNLPAGGTGRRLQLDTIYDVSSTSSIERVSIARSGGSMVGASSDTNRPSSVPRPRQKNAIAKDLAKPITGSYREYDDDSARRKRSSDDAIGMAVRRMQRRGPVVDRCLQPPSSVAPPSPSSKMKENVFQFPAATPAVTGLNYCDVSVIIDTVPTPRSAQLSTTKTDYARIDPLATVAARTASKQRVEEHRSRSSSMLTLISNSGDEPTLAQKLLRRRSKKRSTSRRGSTHE